MFATLVGSKFAYGLYGSILVTAGWPRYRSGALLAPP